MTQNNEEYLTPDEAARHLGVKRRSVERYAENKQINRYRRGITRQVFYKKSELDALLTIRREDELEDR